MFLNPLIIDRKGFEELQDKKFGNKRNNNNSNNKGGYSNHHGGNNFQKGGGVVKRGTYKGGRQSTYNKHHEPPAGLVRNPISESVIQMRDEADKWKNIIQNVDTEDAEKQAKILLNKVTPDNIKKLRSKFADLLINAYNTADAMEKYGTPEEHEKAKNDCKKLIKVFFKKATHEEKYCSMYTGLLKFIMEEEAKNKEAKALEESGTSSPSKSSSPSKKRSKNNESVFRADLIEECKSTLYEFTEELKTNDIPEGDRDDYEYRYKKRLFGNLKLIAELYKKKVVGRQVAVYVLKTLLGMEQHKYNEFTIEGACTFITKVGEKLEKQTKNDDGAFPSIMRKFEEFNEDKNIDVRIRYIIQNALSRRDDGWIDQDTIDGPKTKKQIRQNYMNEINGIEVEPKFAKSKSTKKVADRDQDGSKNDFGLSLAKMESSQSITSEYTEDAETPKPAPKEYSPREMEHMDHEAIKDRLIGNFSEWLNTGKLDLEIFHKPENECPRAKIIEFLL